MVQPQVIAHRGASRAERENTVGAFKRARELGSEAAELDVRVTKDRVLVVHHDDHLSDGRNICDLNHEEIPDYVPTLSDALDACAGMWVNIEIKNWPDDVDFDPADRITAQVAELLAERGEHERWVISAFRRETADAMRTLLPTVRTAWLTMGVRPEDAETTARSLANSGHIALHPYHGFLTKECVDIMHAHGIQVNVWTVDEPKVMARLIDWGVDGIVTNVPDVALGVRANKS